MIRVANAVIALAVCLGSLAFTAGQAAAAGGPPDLKSGDVISWRTPEGIRRLERSQYKADFFSLANNYESQKNRFLCGPASSVIVLNALRDRDHAANNPQDPANFDEQARGYLPQGFNPVYPRYSQDTFFTAATDQIKTRMQVYGQPVTDTAKPDYGLQLRQLGRMLLAHGLTVTVRVVDDTLLPRQIVRELTANLSQPNNYVIVNYSRKAVGQPGSGHFSPLGAYDANSDSFLVMDTAPAVADWVWIRSSVLINAMNTLDTAENRGYLLIADQP